MDNAQRIAKLINDLQKLEKVGKLTKEGARHLKELLKLQWRGIQ